MANMFFLFIRFIMLFFPKSTLLEQKLMILDKELITNKQFFIASISIPMAMVLIYHMGRIRIDKMEGLL